MNNNPAIANSGDQQSRLAQPLEQAHGTILFLEVHSKLGTWRIGRGCTNIVSRILGCIEWGSQQ